MSYYICECGCRFDEPKVISYTDGYGNAAEPDDVVCPNCRQDYFEEYTDCNICGEPVRADAELTICDKCRAKIVNTAVTAVRNALSSEEREALNRIIELEQDAGLPIAV